jgi:hypothetical protein
LFTPSFFAPRTTAVHVAMCTLLQWCAMELTVENIAL